MKRNVLRTMVLVACTLSVFALPVRAQEPAPAPVAGGGMHLPGGQGGYRDPAQREARQLQMMTERLKLTPDQVTQVKAIQDNQHTQMTALRQDTTLQPEDKHTRMMAMRQESD